jgi:hypothetical protein
MRRRRASIIIPPDNLLPRVSPRFRHTIATESLKDVEFFGLFYIIYLEHAYKYTESSV